MRFLKLFLLICLAICVFNQSTLAWVNSAQTKEIKVQKLELKANKASANKAYNQAIDLYSQIIDLQPTDLPKFLNKRANLYIRLNH